MHLANGLVCLHRAVFIVTIVSDLFGCEIRFQCQLFGLYCYCITLHYITLHYIIL